MFVKKNRNRSGSISVQIISKKFGRYRAETVGTSKNPNEIQQFIQEAENRINYPENQPTLIPTLSKTDLAIKNFLENTSNLQIRTIGPELIFGSLFDRIGFNVVQEELFRHIVIARLAYPASKLKTVDYLYRYRGINIKIDEIYRFLDKLNNFFKEIAERVAYE